MPPHPFSQKKTRILQKSTSVERGPYDFLMLSIQLQPEPLLYAFPHETKHHQEEPQQDQHDPNDENDRIVERVIILVEAGQL